MAAFTAADAPDTSVKLYSKPLLQLSSCRTTSGELIYITAEYDKSFSSFSLSSYTTV